jgi:type I restriction enzyme S subunit
VSEEDWELTTVEGVGLPGEQAVLTGPFGSNLGSDDFVSSGVPVLTIGCLTGSGVRLEKAQFVSEQKAGELERYRLAPGDLLFSRMASVGRAAIVPSALRGALFNYHIMRLRLDPRRCLPEMLLAAVQGSEECRQYISDVSRGATRDGVNTQQLLAMPVRLPALDEQRRIVAKLDALRARSRRAKDALDAVPALLDRLRQSILAAAFRGDLTTDWREQNPDVEPASELLKRIRIERRRRWEEAELAKLIAKGKAPKDDRWKAKYVEPEPVDESELPELPEGWCWASVEEVAAPDPRAIQSGPFGSNLLHSEFQSTGMLAIGIDNVLDGAFSLGAQHRISEKKFDELRQYAARPGDVLITVMATIGRCCLVPEGTEPAIITKHVYRVTPNRTAIAPGFLMHAIRGAPAVRAAIADDARGQTRLGLNGAIIKALPVPLASRGEQDAVLAALAVSLGDAQGVAIAVEDADAALRTLDRSILDAAFRGEFLDRQSDASSTDS